MTLFEYIAVAASLICSFVAVRILGGVAAVLRPTARYWVHAAMVFLVLSLLSIQWWLFWSYHDVEWNYARFILALSPLGLLYVVGSLLIPSNIDEIESWRDHYFEIRFRLFAVSLAALVMLVLCTVVLLGHPVLHPRRVVPGLIGVLLATGMVSKSPKVHAAITIIYAMLLLVVAVVFARPVSFGDAP